MRKGRERFPRLFIVFAEEDGLRYIHVHIHIHIQQNTYTSTYASTSTSISNKTHTHPHSYPTKHIHIHIHIHIQQNTYTSTSISNKTHTHPHPYPTKHSQRHSTRTHLSKTITDKHHTCTYITQGKKITSLFLHRLVSSWTTRRRKYDFEPNGFTRMRIMQRKVLTVSRKMLAAYPPILP